MVDSPPDKSLMIAIGEAPGHPLSQRAHKSVINTDARPAWNVAKRVIEGEALLIVRPGDLIRRQRKAARALAGAHSGYLPFDQCDFMLKLRDRARKQPERLPVVAAKRMPQLGLVDRIAKVFQDNDARVIATGAIVEMSDLACHGARAVVTQTVTIERRKGLLCKSYTDIQWGSVVGPEGLEPPTKAL